MGGLEYSRIKNDFTLFTQDINGEVWQLKNDGQQKYLSALLLGINTRGDIIGDAKQLYATNELASQNGIDVNSANTIAVAASLGIYRYNSKMEDPYSVLQVIGSDALTGPGVDFIKNLSHTEVYNPGGPRAQVAGAVGLGVLAGAVFADGWSSLNPVGIIVGGLLFAASLVLSSDSSEEAPKTDEDRKKAFENGERVGDTKPQSAGKMGAKGGVPHEGTNLDGTDEEIDKLVDKLGKDLKKTDEAPNNPEKRRDVYRDEEGRVRMVDRIDEKGKRNIEIHSYKNGKVKVEDIHVNQQGRNKEGRYTHTPYGGTVKSENNTVGRQITNVEQLNTVWGTRTTTTYNNDDVDITFEPMVIKVEPLDPPNNPTED